MTDPSTPELVLALTGASGMPYARRLLEVLVGLGRRVVLSISSAGAQVLEQELGVRVALDAFEPRTLVPGAAHGVRYCHYQDFSDGLASGSFPTAGMVVCPCSMGTLGAIATATPRNLIHRAADVHLKERRPLVLVPRETPLHAIHLEHMASLARLGVCILPPAPGFYHRPRTVDDLVDFVVTRICDQLGLPHALAPRWGQAPGTGHV